MRLPCVLVSPSKWDDPFENFILESDAKFPSGKIIKGRLHSEFYGQCWTLNRTSDAMWRIYSHKNQGIRIRTSIELLAESLSRSLSSPVEQPQETGLAFIGRVLYFPRKDLKGYAGKAFSHGLSCDAVAKTLLVKRNAFRHEREVRLLFLNAGYPVKNGIFYYAIDPCVLIDQVMIDPRVPKDRALHLKNEIEKKTGLQREKILHSRLYSAPKKLIIPVRKLRSR